MPVSPETAEIVTRKKSQYGRYIDTKQWKSIDQVALPDAEHTFLDIDGSVLKIGPARYTSFPANRLRNSAASSSRMPRHFICSDPAS